MQNVLYSEIRIYNIATPFQGISRPDDLLVGTFAGGSLPFGIRPIPLR
ncbi:hypothetical protein Mpal_1758 [Methanosphaerula palustris E1-9c]|uniref:Uncharacterized protein n=1 Tax=Methanosphaerula palustris (strain ATCC BAA-1556 / DSM 19958 / E1-9c) TaxID=521011 RepID=B8GJZ4_METPE|nr:hypothetical protein Mpal_1758 [Methanosphaerula palustris E1-9c]